MADETSILLAAPCDVSLMAIPPPPDHKFTLSSWVDLTGCDAGDRWTPKTISTKWMVS
jgi:hypothetical protein